MSPFTSAAIDCIRIQDAASAMLETDGIASTERIAQACGLPVAEVSGVMGDLLRTGAARFSQGLQVWLLAND